MEKQSPSLTPLLTAVWYLCLAMLTALIYAAYGGLVSYITSPGAGWRGFLLAFSSVIPLQAVLWIYNYTVVRRLRFARLWAVLLDIAALAVLLLNIDYSNLRFLEF
ncbi:MAG: hypothetical protein K2L16_08450 [Muribaculaceae bacterium]|nr:hypothetical protein [Muribaculaceae bacterium]